MNILEKKTYLERRKEAIISVLELKVGTFLEFTIPVGQYGAFRTALNRYAGAKRFSMQKGDTYLGQTNFQILRTA